MTFSTTARFGLITIALVFPILSGCVQSTGSSTSALSSVVEENRARQTAFQKTQQEFLDKQKALVKEQQEKQLALMKPDSVKKFSAPNSANGPSKTPQAKKASVTSTSRAANVTANAPWKCVPDSLKVVLNEVSRRYGPVTVNSTHRSRSKNRRVGGARHSYHLHCQAVDFRVKGDNAAVMRYLRRHPNVGGLKRYRSGYFHIDTGPRRTWR